jgi:hypothetical protein
MLAESPAIWYGGDDRAVSRISARPLANRYHSNPTQKIMPWTCATGQKGLIAAIVWQSTSTNKAGPDLRPSWSAWIRLTSIPRYGLLFIGMTSYTRVCGKHCCRFHRFILRHPLQLSIANFSALCLPANSQAGARSSTTPSTDAVPSAGVCARPLGGGSFSFPAAPSDTGTPL